MKLIAEETLGPLIFDGKVSLYVYDSDSKESLKQVRAFLPGIEARNKWRFETIEGLTGGMPVIENGRVTLKLTGDLYILINLGANANAVENTLPHQLTHLAFDLMHTLSLDVSESEPAALLIGNLNEKWAPLVRKEVERKSREEENSEMPQTETEDSADEKE